MIRLIAIAIFISTAPKEHVTVAQSDGSASADGSDQPTATTNDQPTLGGSTMNGIRGRTTATDTMMVESHPTHQPGNDSDFTIIIIPALAFFGGVSGIFITVAIGSVIIACYCIYKKR